MTRVPFGPVNSILSFGAFWLALFTSFHDRYSISPGHEVAEFVFRDQVGEGSFSQFRMAIRANPQSSRMRPSSLCSGGAQPKCAS